MVNRMTQLLYKLDRLDEKKFATLGGGSISTGDSAVPSLGLQHSPFNKHSKAASRLPLHLCNACSAAVGSNPMDTSCTTNSSGCDISNLIFLEFGKLVGAEVVVGDDRFMGAKNCCLARVVSTIFRK